MDAHLNWFRQRLLADTAVALENNGFATALFETRAAAVEFLLEEARPAQTIGFGGSMTLAELGIARSLEGTGKTLLIHGRPEFTAAERRQVMCQQLTCDLFLSGTNAVTRNGMLVNIDATGNRVGAISFGPGKVWVVAGVNKIVPNLDSALKRIKERVSPPNARRLGYKTPCATTGICAECNSPDRICRITTIIERCPRITALGVCLINEDLGY